LWKKFKIKNFGWLSINRRKKLRKHPELRKLKYIEKNDKKDADNWNRIKKIIVKFINTLKVFIIYKFKIKLIIKRVPVKYS